MTGRLACAIFLSTISLTSVRAQVPASPLKILLCRAVEDHTARLKCYDDTLAAIAAAASQAPTPNTPAETSKSKTWNLVEDKSPLDDSANLAGMLTGNDGHNSLVLRCKEHKTEAAVLFDKYLGSGTTVGRVIYRMNDAAPVNAHWSGSTNGRAVFAPKAITFIRSLPTRGKLFIRAFDFQGNSRDATFELGDLDDLRTKLAMTCKWPNVADEAAPPKAKHSLKKPSKPSPGNSISSPLPLSLLAPK